MNEDGSSTLRDRDRLMVTVAHLVAGLLLLLGVIALLRTAGLDGTSALLVFTIHPLTGLVWTVLGFVGIAMGTRLGWTHRYLVWTGGILLGWAVLCLVLDGQPSDLFVRDIDLIVFNGILGLLALTAALTDVPARLIGTIE